MLFLSAAAMLGVSIATLPLAMSGPKQLPTVALGPTDTYFVSQTSLGTRFRSIPGSLPQPKARPKPFAAMRSSC